VHAGTGARHAWVCARGVARNAQQQRTMTLMHACDSTAPRTEHAGCTMATRGVRDRRACPTWVNCGASERVVAGSAATSTATLAHPLLLGCSTSPLAWRANVCSVPRSPVCVCSWPRALCPRSRLWMLRCRAGRPSCCCRALGGRRGAVLFLIAGQPLEDNAHFAAVRTAWSRVSISGPRWYRSPPTHMLVQWLCWRSCRSCSCANARQRPIGHVRGRKAACWAVDGSRHAPVPPRSRRLSSSSESSVRSTAPVIARAKPAVPVVGRAPLFSGPSALLLQHLLHDSKCNSCACGMPALGPHR
jgi:hypothetical protein